LATSSPIQGSKRSSTWLHRWVYYLATGFMFAAAALRSILVFQDSPLLSQIAILLAAWPLMFIGNVLFARRLPWLPVLLLGAEILLILYLLLITRADFLAFLFAIPSMQAMQQYTKREGWILVGLTTLLTFLALLKMFGIFYALGIAVVFFGGSVFLITYIGATRRASLIQEQQQALVSELEQANRQLESYAQQLQQLAAGRERQRLARELHDSVTQTIFSMTLTTQSAVLLLEQDRGKVAAQLDRLDLLAHSALAEMQTLISKLAPENTGGFVAALQQHLADRRRLDDLSVSLDVKGSQPLSAAEEQSLLRIAQEALNNVVKHAGVAQAAIRLHLEGQPWLEIEDHGVGFEPAQAGGGGQVGLVSMQERAAEIGWSLRVDASPGKGTRIKVQKDAGG
jgi:signal transduction histidine kinase